MNTLPLGVSIILKIFHWGHAWEINWKVAMWIFVREALLYVSISTIDQWSHSCLRCFLWHTTFEKDLLMIMNTFKWFVTEISHEYLLRTEFESTRGIVSPCRLDMQNVSRHGMLQLEVNELHMEFSFTEYEEITTSKGKTSHQKDWIGI